MISRKRRQRHPRAPLSPPTPFTLSAMPLNSLICSPARTERQLRQDERLFHEVLAPRGLGFHRHFHLPHRARPRGFGYPQMPFPRRFMYNDHLSPFRGRSSSWLTPTYRTPTSLYRNPYMSYGFRRACCGRGGWPARSGHYPYYSRQGYPPNPYRQESYTSSWYNDDRFSDDGEDGYDFSDTEDAYYRSWYDSRSRYFSEYDDDDEVCWDEEESDFDDDDYDGYYSSYDSSPGRYGTYGYSNGW